MTGFSTIFAETSVFMLVVAEDAVDTVALVSFDLSLLSLLDENMLENQLDFFSATGFSSSALFPLFPQLESHEDFLSAGASGSP